MNSKYLVNRVPITVSIHIGHLIILIADLQEKLLILNNIL
jgi:hypothetical protein